MPTLPSIRTSIENNQSLVIDSFARQGIFRRDKRGRLCYVFECSAFCLEEAKLRFLPCPI